MSRILTPINIGAFELANRRIHLGAPSLATAAGGSPAERTGSLHFAAPVAVLPAGADWAVPALAPDPAGDASLRRAVEAIRDGGGLPIARLAHRGETTSPPALHQDAIDGIIAAFAAVARRAFDAGFDGIEIDGSDGGLVDRFLADQVNTRGDRYGGSAENRAQLLLEIVEAVTADCPRDRLGVRLSPFAHGAAWDGDPALTHACALAGLYDLEIAFVHLRVPATAGPSPSFFPGDADQRFRSAFRNGLLLSGALDQARAEDAILRRFADAVGFDADERTP